MLMHSENSIGIGLRTIDFVDGIAQDAFCIVARSTKRPDAQRWNAKPKDIGVADSALRNGYNIGLIVQHTDFVIIDIDRQLHEFLSRFPAFETCLQFYRENAPDKAKFLVRVNGVKPHSIKHSVEVDGKRQSVFELLSISGQAVIAGTHSSGAPILCNYEDPITLTFDELAIIVKLYTGRTIEPYEAHIIKKPEKSLIPVDDFERARQNLARLQPHRADDYSDWILVGFCLKNLGDSAFLLWDDWSKQSAKYKAGECRYVWSKMGTPRVTLNTLTYLANIDDPDGKRSSRDEEADQLIAEWAAVIRTYPFEGRSAEHQRAIAYAFLLHAYSANATEFAASYDQLSLMSGTGKKTVFTHLDKFSFMVERVQTGCFTFATTWKLRHIDTETLATLTKGNAYTLNVVVAEDTPQLHSKYMRFSKSMWLNEAFACLMGKDAFIAPRVAGERSKRKQKVDAERRSGATLDDSGLSPLLKKEERRKAILARLMHKVTRENNGDLEEGQYKSMKPLQKTSLRILDLYEQGLRGNPQTFADEMGCNVQTVRDAINRMDEQQEKYDLPRIAWIQRKGDGTTEIVVAENWRQLVNVATGYMSTNGIQEKRNLQMAADRIARVELALSKTSTAAAREKLEEIVKGAHAVISHITGQRHKASDDASVETPAPVESSDMPDMPEAQTEEPAYLLIEMEDKKANQAPMLINRLHLGSIYDEKFGEVELVESFNYAEMAA